MFYIFDNMGYNRVVGTEKVLLLRIIEGNGDGEKAGLRQTKFAIAIGIYIYT